MLRQQMSPRCRGPVGGRVDFDWTFSSSDAPGVQPYICSSALLSRIDSTDGQVTTPIPAQVSREQHRSCVGVLAIARQATQLFGGVMQATAGNGHSFPPTVHD